MHLYVFRESDIDEEPNPLLANRWAIASELDEPFLKTRSSAQTIAEWMLSASPMKDTIASPFGHQWMFIDDVSGGWIDVDVELTRH
jgi:hypothetical protein